MPRASCLLQTESLSAKEAPSTRLEHTVVREGAALVRHVRAGAYEGVSRIDLCDLPGGILDESPGKAWLLAMLRGANPSFADSRGRSIRSVDLFCGPGGFSAGLSAAAAAVGLELRVEACVDTDQSALQVFRRNHAPRLSFSDNADALVDFGLRFDADTTGLAYPPMLMIPALSDLRGRIDLVVGGPPCQGHSNLNNRTRRIDPRNMLYLTVAAIGVALEAPVIIIENVPSVLADSNHVVDKARSLLAVAGYRVDATLLEADRFGAAQQRKRHFLMATRNAAVPLSSISSQLDFPVLTALDAINDLVDIAPESLFDQPNELSEENRARIDYMFDHGVYNLPDEIRPDCHKNGHTYPSVYGRMYPDRPAQTITGGFLTPGRGRFVHPTERRALTPREGARLQGFSDAYAFERADGVALYRKDFAKLIGDAVPPPLAFAVALAAITSLAG